VKQKIGPEKADRIYRIHKWIHFIIMAVGLPAISIAIMGYQGVWNVIFLFGFCGLLAWTIYWTNWINSIIFAVGGPLIITAITGYHSIWNIIIFLAGCGFIVWLCWAGLWVKKRVFEEYYEDKNRTDN
jgi:hypothetical protein